MKGLMTFTSLVFAGDSYCKHYRIIIIKLKIPQTPEPNGDTGHPQPAGYPGLVDLAWL